MVTLFNHKKKALFLGFLLLVFCSCISESNSKGKNTKVAEADSLKVNSLRNTFLSLALEGTNGDRYLRKWEQDIKIFCEYSKQNKPKKRLFLTLDSIISILNSMSPGIKTERVQNSDSANVTIFLGDKTFFIKQTKKEIQDVELMIESNILGTTYTFNHYTRFYYVKAYMFVDTRQNIDKAVFTLKHEMLHLLGLVNHTKNQNSVLSKPWYSDVKIGLFSDLDFELITMIQNPELKSGMQKKDILRTLSE